MALPPTGTRVINFKLAVLWHQKHASGSSTDLTQGRFVSLYNAIQSLGMRVYPIVYSDENLDQVRSELLQMDAVLVWINPVEKGESRQKLNQLLREVSEAGVFVSTHPDVIDQLGTKGVLFSTREMSWGSDVHRYDDYENLCRRFPEHLHSSGARVLKKHSDSSGAGVWKVEHLSGSGKTTFETTNNTSGLSKDVPIRVRQAARGGEDVTTTLSDFLASIKHYFDDSGYIVDQAYQNRLDEGMTRCYMVRDVVGGFGHQKVNALLPASIKGDKTSIPIAGQRLYYPPDTLEFQTIKNKMETQWLGELLATLNLEVEQLPVLWDADFLPGATGEPGDYVLCEINTSSVHPYPETIPELVAAEVYRRLVSYAS